jgi:hypothetical protein
MMRSTFDSAIGLKGIPACEPFSAPEFSCQAAESWRLEQLPWPRNLFGEPASIADWMDASAQTRETADNARACGCREEHHHNVSPASMSPTFAIIPNPARKDEK